MVFATFFDIERLKHDMHNDCPEYLRVYEAALEQLSHCVDGEGLREEWEVRGDDCDGCGCGGCGCGDGEDEDRGEDKCDMVI